MGKDMVIGMEKAFEDKTTYTLQNEDEIGIIKIADDVVAMIAGLAATEVEGVSALAGNVTNEIMSKMGVRTVSRGVKVEVFQKSVKVEISLIVDYGYSIPVISQRVQSRVKMTIENMTGLEVVDVNIRITGVNVTADK